MSDVLMMLTHCAVPPRVQPEPPTGEIVVRSGASVNLECKVRVT